MFPKLPPPAVTNYIKLFLLYIRLMISKIFLRKYTCYIEYYVRTCTLYTFIHNQTLYIFYISLFYLCRDVALRFILIYLIFCVLKVTRVIFLNFIRFDMLCFKTKNITIFLPLTKVIRRNVISQEQVRSFFKVNFLV